MRMRASVQLYEGYDAYGSVHEARPHPVCSGNTFSGGTLCVPIDESAAGNSSTCLTSGLQPRCRSVTASIPANQARCTQQSVWRDLEDDVANECSAPVVACAACTTCAAPPCATAAPTGGVAVDRPCTKSKQHAGKLLRWPSTPSRGPVRNCMRAFLSGVAGCPATSKPEPVPSCSISEGTPQGSNHGQSHLCADMRDNMCESVGASITSAAHVVGNAWFAYKQNNAIPSVCTRWSVQVSYCTRLLTRCGSRRTILCTLVCFCGWGGVQSLSCENAPDDLHNRVLLNTCRVGGSSGR